MKAESTQTKTNRVRRDMLGALAGAAAGFVGWKVARRGVGDHTAPAASSASASAASFAGRRVSSLGAPVVKPARYSVKRHG